jgi:hypothetical protein
LFSSLERAVGLVSVTTSGVSCPPENARTCLGLASNAFVAFKSDVTTGAGRSRRLGGDVAVRTGCHRCGVRLVKAVAERIGTAALGNRSGWGQRG